MQKWRKTPSPWWDKDRHKDRRPRLLARARIIAAMRQWFAGEGFLEVETSALQVSPGNETHLHGFATEAIGLDGIRERFYLHTSPEFAMKKLLAAGESQIVAFAPVYRNRERGPLHHPEFTMVEWYRVAMPYTRLMDDCAALLQLAVKAAGVPHLSWKGKTCDVMRDAERLSVEEAFMRYANFALLTTTGDRDALALQAEGAGVRIAHDDSWSDIVSKVLTERIEPHLGIGQPTILMDYPISEAALARPKADDPRVAERFELYACGVELANAFGELTDADEQRRRFGEDMALKAEIYGETYPLDEDFLLALTHMPESSGIALGLDRLIMLATHANHIEDVLWAPVAAHGTVP